MPVLTLPSPYPYVDGAAVSGTGLLGLFWDPTSPDTSLAIVNGLLDDDNLDVTLTHELTQLGSQLDVVGAAGTANLDFKYVNFGEYDYTFTVDDEFDPFVYIPGGSVEFHNKWDDSYALITWTVTWASDSIGDDPAATIMLLVDDAYVTTQRRNVGRCTSGTGIGEPEGYKKGRTWSGHALVAITSRGWHSAGLAVLTDKDIRQTRTYAVSISVMQMRAITDITP